MMNKNQISMLIKVLIVGVLILILIVTAIAPY